MKEKLLGEFRQRFNKPADHLFFCPGRVNLIGEHIDYNGGRVLPCAISNGIWLAASPNEEHIFRLHCLNFPETEKISIEGPFERKGSSWFNFPVGVMHELSKMGHTLPGFDLLYYGNLPIAAGLSSSAAIEVLTVFALTKLSGISMDSIPMVLLAKRVENDFIGLNSGVMDQFAVAMGKKDHAILLDCDTLAYEHIPFRTGSFQLMIINSKKQRALAESKYNERFAECREALKLLQQELNISNLCAIDIATFDQYKHLVSDPVLEKRAMHVISENARVKDAAVAMQTGDMITFGKLMYASHESLQEWYEVSGRELDTIVDFSKKFQGCIGARMTGAGFGGCAIALIEKGKVEKYSEELIQHYQSEIGYAPEVFTADAEEGVRAVDVGGSHK